MPDHIKTYIKAIERDLEAGQATEHTHRHALKQLIETLLPKATATNEPRRVKCGAPDFLVSKARQGLTIGYIETKDIGKSLDEAEKSGQLKRYRRSLENLILTDYLEFRWYVDGELREKASLAGMVKPERLARDREGEAQVLELLKSFLGHPPARVGTPQELAGRMARLTHMMRDIIIEAFETNQASPLLAELRQAFARTLIPDLDTPAKTAEFADMYAQTIAYGLFAARCNHQEALPFKRLGAAGEIPRTNPFLRRLFETITGTELDDEPYAGFVDDLVQLLDHADMEAVLEHFGQRSRGRDPAVHFYETFLAEYDPRLREKRGVYYTPEPVVSYIVHSVDHILKDRFDCPQGLADTSTLSYTREDGTRHETPKVLILDPACGTGTFLYTVVDLIRDQFMKRRDAGMWSGYVRKHLLPRLFGFELLMAPYAVAHFKLGMQLAGQDMIPRQRDTWRYDFASHERLGVYLTNTLEEAERVTQRDMYFLERTIAEEADSAAEIKRDLPIMVIMGNPPYSGHSANRGQYDQKVQKNEEYITGWTAGLNGTAIALKTTAKHEGVKKQPTFINRLVKDYFVCNGEWLQERNPKWLQDDYVKFIRWAQWRIERTGAGVLGFITNHGYLDNPTFRGMRWQLMKAFSEIYILDLHGNAKKKEVSPDGSKDENVFDIQQGVSIGIFIKEPNKTGPAKVFHSEMYGVREGKYLRLYEWDLASTKWAKLNPQPPFYLFLPQDTRRSKEYERGWPVTEILPVNSVGLVTARDKLTIHMTPEEVWETVRDFSSLAEEMARKKYSLGKDAQDWKVHLAQADLQASGPVKKKITPILYRPFDTRYTYYTGQTKGFICRPRQEVMGHML